MGAWLEGNAVVAPDGQLVDVLRVQTRSPDEKAAIVRISPDGKTAAFDPATGFVAFPGGAKKFAIRFDPQSRLYWSLASIVHPRHRAENPGSIRNTLALTSSSDLVHWEVRSIVLYHPDVKKHGFQYVDWLFDGDDLIAACRTAYDDGQGGAHNAHDANYLTFHRIAGFRNRTMADSVPLAELPAATAAADAFTASGPGWSLATLEEGAVAFGNRAYVWRGVPNEFRGWRFTQTSGGEPAEIRVRVSRDTTLLAITAHRPPSPGLAGWEKVPGSEFCYTDAGQSPMAVFRRQAKSGEDLSIPQTGWTGTALLIPPTRP
jgi:hypothetical protein